MRRVTAPVRDPRAHTAWLVASVLVQELPMSPEAADEFYYVPEDPEEQRRIKTRYAKRWVEAYPEAAADLIAAVRQQAEQALRLERLAGLRHSVLAVLAARGLAVSDDLRARVEAASDLAVLDAWLLAAATATRADDAIR